MSPETTNSVMAFTPRTTKGWAHRAPAADIEDPVAQRQRQAADARAKQRVRTGPGVLDHREEEAPHRTKQGDQEPAVDEPTQQLLRLVRARPEPQADQEPHQRGRDRRDRAQEALRVPSLLPQVRPEHKAIDDGADVAFRRQVVALTRWRPESAGARTSSRPGARGRGRPHEPPRRDPSGDARPRPSPIDTRTRRRGSRGRSAAGHPETSSSTALYVGKPLRKSPRPISFSARVTMLRGEDALRDSVIATPTMKRKNGKIRSVGVHPSHGAWPSGQ